MELVNATGMEAGWTLGMDPDGREYVVVAVKGTFTIRSGGGEVRLADQQVPLVMADEFTGEPGFSATLYESEFPLYKPKCDVLLNGSAYAPGGKPTNRVTVGLKVGRISKGFSVVGDRVWEKSAGMMAVSSPEPFTQMPITYDRAYGGTDVSPRDPEKAKAYMLNPVGVGYYPLSDGDALLGRPLPNMEELDRPAIERNGKYRPMSLGAIGRNFESRIPFAGTYDQDWIDNVFPFLPKDFNPLYHQVAPPDQQMDHPKGGEWVELFNLTPEGKTVLQLPEMEMPVEFTDEDFERTEVQAVIDTIIIEPGHGRIMLVWRASRALKRDIFEMRQGVVGRMPSGWYRARSLGKDYYPSLKELVASRAEEEGAA
ncbi:DUF2169 domain-containing protein [Gemmatimonadota bacterium]